MENLEKVTFFQYRKNAGCQKVNKEEVPVMFECLKVVAVKTFNVKMMLFAKNFASLRIRPKLCDILYAHQ